MQQKRSFYKVLSKLKNLVLVLANSLFVTETSKEDNTLEKILYIYYLIWFKKNKVQALFDLSNKVNIMTSAFTSKLRLKICHTNVRAQKIDNFTLEMFEMALASFWRKDKLGRARFFQETFLLANISTKVVLVILFLNLSNANIQFIEKEFTWRFYTTTEALPTIKRVEFIDKRKFVKVVLNKDSENFVIYIAVLEVLSKLAEMTIYPKKETRIAFLLTKKLKILEEYSNFAKVFLKEKALVLPE